MCALPQPAFDLCFIAYRELLYISYVILSSQPVQQLICSHISYEKTKVKLSCLICLSSLGGCIAETDHVTLARPLYLLLQLS